MLSRVASGSRGTSAASAKHLYFGYKQNSGCVPSPLLALPHFLQLYFVPGDESGFADIAEVQREPLAALDSNSVEEFR